MVGMIWRSSRRLCVEEQRPQTAAQVEIPLAVGGGSVPVVLPGVANVAGNPPGVLICLGQKVTRNMDFHTLAFF